MTKLKTAATREIKRWKHMKNMFQQSRDWQI